MINLREGTRVGKTQVWSLEEMDNIMNNYQLPVSLMFLYQ